MAGRPEPQPEEDRQQEMLAKRGPQRRTDRLPGRLDVIQVRCPPAAIRRVKPQQPKSNCRQDAEKIDHTDQRSKEQPVREPRPVPEKAAVREPQNAKNRPP